MKNQVWYILSFFLISAAIVIIWFHNGLGFGGGEAGIIFYRLPNEFHIIANSWVEKAIGNPTGIVTILYPLFALLSFFQNQGMSSVILQAAIFFVIFLTGFLGAYFLTKQLTNNPFIAFSSSLFYNFNLMAMIDVWLRFQYPFMFFYAVLPLSLYLFIKGLQERNILYSLVLNLLLFCFVFGFSSMPLIVLFWILLGFYCLFFILLNRHNIKDVYFSLGYLFISLLIFFLINLWWIIQTMQYFFSTTYQFQQSYTTVNNFLDFDVLSKNLGNLNFLIRLMHKDFFVWMAGVWKGTYQMSVFIALSFLPILFIFGSILVKRKTKDYYFFLFLTLFTLFFAKGDNSPFGGIFSFLFLHVKVLEVFRNPFEKIGLSIPLGYSPLFGIGLYSFYTLIAKRSKKLAICATFFILISVCGVLVWPMWNGWVLTSYEPPADNTDIGNHVEVPSYYQAANHWLNHDQSDFRTIAFPLQDEGVKYSWRYGYNGVDPSASLFDKPFLAFCTSGEEYLCSLTKTFQQQLFNQPDTFWKVLPSLNVKYIMLRNDIDFRQALMKNPNDFNPLLHNNMENISYITSFDKLSFFKLTEQYVNPKIFASPGSIYFSSSDFSSFVLATPYSNYSPQDIYMTDPNTKQLNFEIPNTKQIIVKSSLFSQNPLVVSHENAMKELPYIRFLPDSRFYFLSRLKEKINRFLSGSNYFRESTIESDKRIVEASKLVKKNEYSLALKMVNEYLVDLSSFLNNPQIVSDTGSEMDLLRQRYIVSDTMITLEKAKHDGTLYKRAYSLLTIILQKLNVLPLYPVDFTKFSSHRVIVPQDGSYQIIFETPVWETYYQQSDLQVFVDGRATNVIHIDSTKSSQIFFEQKLTKGVHQIDIEIPLERNIASSEQSEYVFDTKDTIKELTIPFLQFDPYSSYNISYDYILDKGVFPSVFVTHDIDIIRLGKRVVSNNFSGVTDIYLGNRWHHAIQTLIPNRNARTANLVFEIVPLSICKKQRSISNCEMFDPKRIIDPETKIHLKNITITRRLDNTIFLIENKNPLTFIKTPKVTYKKMDPARYQVTVDNATTPFFLTFLESFHPLWRAYYIDNSNKIEVSTDKHFFVNSFANGWFVDKKGSYTMLIEFYPENLLQVGEIISFFSVIVLSFLTILLFVKKKNEARNR